MSEAQDAGQSRWLTPPIQIAATALAGITAAFVGSMLGVYGTVLGAGLASGMTTVGASLYERSLQRTKEKVREGAEKMPLNRARRQQPAAAQQTRVISPARGVNANTTDPPTVKFRPVDGAAVAGAGAASPGKSRRARWLLIIGTTVAGFVAAMFVVTGVETVNGQALSGGHGTSVSGFFQRHGGSGDTSEQRPSRQQESSTAKPTEQQPPRQDEQSQVPQQQPPEQQEQPPRGETQQPQRQRPPQRDEQGRQSQQQESPSQQQEQKPQRDGPSREEQAPQQEQEPQQGQAPQRDEAPQRGATGQNE